MRDNEPGTYCFDFQEFVCDGYKQCADGSDEGKQEVEEPLVPCLKTNYSPLPQGQGCNLYPDSGCDSIGGLLHFKCSRTSECFNSEQEAEKCEAGEDVSSGGCQRDEFKCFGGRCIPMHQVCRPKAASANTI